MLTYFGLNSSEHNEHRLNAVQMLFLKTVEKPSQNQLLQNCSTTLVFPSNLSLKISFPLLKAHKKSAFLEKKEKKIKGCELMLMANSLLPKQILTTCSTKTPKRIPTKSGQPRKATNKNDPWLTRGIDMQSCGLDCKY
jgi:hypothetical protein